MINEEYYISSQFYSNIILRTYAIFVVLIDYFPYQLISN